MNAPTKRVAMIGIFHETNTFSPIATEYADFAKRWYVGQEFIDDHEGTQTVIGGYIDGGRDAGFSVVPIFGAYATPSGTVSADAFARICETLTAQLAACEEVDGILLELHGDFVTDAHPDAEEHFVEIIRRRFPSQPIATVLDMHASMSLPRLRDIDILIGYRTNPHIDTYERGVDAAALLKQVLSGALTPYRAHRGLAVVAAPPSQRTDSEPMKSLWAAADRLTAELDLRNVTVHGGYAYADAVYAGLGFEATGDVSQREAAEKAVTELHALALTTVSAFRTDYPDVENAIEDAISGPAPVAIADTGDNINGGTPGDTTWLLREALRRDGYRFLSTIADRNSLEIARAAGVGSSVELNLGGTASPRSGGALQVTAEVLALGEGSFANTGPMQTGAVLDMDGAAWIRFDNCDVVLQGDAVQPNDTNLFRSIGIVPEEYDVLLLKGAAALRAAWSPVVSRIVDAGTPGETDAMVARLPFTKARLLKLTGEER